MKVRIPSPLRSYTKTESEVEGSGSSLSDVLANLDKKYPGIRFRMIDEQGGIRQHIKFFINHDETNDLQVSVSETDTVHIICALSGG
jgi:molybdopterin converting factor small subunit